MPRILNIDLLGSNWPVERKPVSSWNEEWTMCFAWICKAQFPGHWGGEYLPKIQILAWELLLYTQFVILVICVIYEDILNSAVSC